MKHFLFSIIVLLITLNVEGQTYHTAAIIAKADSIMIKTVGEKIFRLYFTLDTTSYYEYTKRNGKSGYEILTAKPINKHKFKIVNVRYIFTLNVYNRPGAWCRVKFDDYLIPVESVLTDFIPKYLKEGKPCNFITDSVALQIAEKTFTRKGIKPFIAGLEYDSRGQRYIWRLSNIVREWEHMNHLHGETELLELDAISGEKLSYYPDVLMGTIH